MIIVGMWVELQSETYWKITASICVFTIALAHLSLLSMARLAEWFQWSLIAAYLIIFGVASLITAMIFFEIDETDMFRLLGVAAIVDAAITVLIPIFHRLSRKELSLAAQGFSEIQYIDAEILALQQKIAELEMRKERALSQH